jgi:hypothetical protein
MRLSNWSKADPKRAQQIWSEYQQHHDVSEKRGQTAGIDPVTGYIWFGDSVQDVIAQRDAAANTTPLFFVRVGSAAFYRKGGRLDHCGTFRGGGNGSDVGTCRGLAISAGVGRTGVCVGTAVACGKAHKGGWPIAQ